MAKSYDDISIEIQNEAGIFGLFMFIAYQRTLTYMLLIVLQMLINV